MILLAYYRIFRSISSLWKFYTHVFSIKEGRGTRIKKLVTIVSTEERSGAVYTSRQILCTDDFFSRFTAVVLEGIVVDFSPDPVTVLALYFFRNYCFSIAWNTLTGGDNDVRTIMCIA